MLFHLHWLLFAVVDIWYGKTRMAGLQSGEGRMMIDSVVWAQYINVTDTQTATSPQQMSRQALFRAAKTRSDVEYCSIAATEKSALFTLD